MLALSGAWNGHLDMQPCDGEGDPLPGSQTTRLWQACLPALHCRARSGCAWPRAAFSANLPTPSAAMLPASFQRIESSSLCR